MNSVAAATTLRGWALAQDMRHSGANVPANGWVLRLPTTPDRVLSGSPPAGNRALEDLSPFASLESAQEYISLLGAAVDEAQNDIQQEIEAAQKEHAERRREALYVVNYKLSRLRHQVTATGRLLNDLRILRRLLLGERNPRPISHAQKRHRN